MGMRTQVPNFFTLVNLACGVLALWVGIQYEMKGRFSAVALPLIAGLLLLATLADFLDGFFARKLKMESELGKALDSLADMVSFGLVPFFLLALHLSSRQFPGTELLPLVFLFPVLGSAYRLATFNVTPQIRGFFTGLPTPANAYLHISLYIGLHVQAKEVPTSPFSVLLVSLWCLFITYLLNARQVKCFALKGNPFSTFRKVGVLILVVFSLILIGLFQWFAAVPILFLYLLLSAWLYRKEFSSSAYESSTL